MTLPLILASASPRRRELLNQIGLEHQVLAVDIDEAPLLDETPTALVNRLAEHKAIAGFAAYQVEHLSTQAIVLAADTVVVSEGKALGKPVDKVEHAEMLTMLSGSTHNVITAFSIKSAEKQYTEAVISEVTFSTLNSQTISDYWQSGEPADKAGGYAIQGYGAVFVKRLSGSYTGVVGLPVHECVCALRQFGVDV